MKIFLNDFKYKIKSETIRNKRKNNKSNTQQQSSPLLLRLNKKMYVLYPKTSLVTIENPCRCL